MSRFFCGVLSSLVILTATTQVLLAQQCTNPEQPRLLSPADQKTVVINDQNILRKLADFSLGRTLGRILETASQGTDTQANREYLLESMLASFKAKTLRNEDSELDFQLTPRPDEAALTAKALLDQSAGAKDAMHVVGVFNRLDLAPASFQNCGEYRIVYAKQSAIFKDRLTLIFEAALPNPDPNGSPAGCRPAVELWKSFQTKNDADIAKALDAFYFAGGDPTGSGKASYESVVHYAHYGSPSGQVRANAFVQPNATQLQSWHLRQWRVHRDTSGTATFAPVPLNENAAPAFYGGPSAGINPTDIFNQRKGFFQNEFVRLYIGQLTAPDTSFAVARVNGGETTLIGGVGVDIDDAFYTPDSAASPTDDPNALAQGSPLLLAIEKQLLDSKLNQFCGLTAKHILNRVGAMSCGGCHQFSNGAEIAPQILWPSSLGFVHIKEDSTLSSLLLDRFLPQRKAIADKFLADTPANAPAGPLRASAIASAAATVRTQLARPGKVETTQQIVEFATLQSTLAKSRKSEKNEPGAFVFTRRSH